jgi:hypothetical protein
MQNVHYLRKFIFESLFQPFSALEFMQNLTEKGHKIWQKHKNSKKMTVCNTLLINMTICGIIIGQITIEVLRKAINYTVLTLSSWLPEHCPISTVSTAIFFNFKK